MNNKNKRLEIDETWFPVDCDDIKNIFCTVYNNGLRDQQFK